MPLLELTPKMIGPDRNSICLAYIESVMLWPNDEFARTRWIEAAGAESLLQDATRIAKGTQGDEVALPKGLILTMDLILRNTPRLNDVRHQAWRPYARGVLAGEILGDALPDQMVGRREGLQAIKAAVAQRYRGKRHFDEGLSVSTFENLIWKVYGPAAHLWAAFLFLAVERASVFPCALGELPRFLALAERLRQDGESCRPRQSKTTILEPKKTWKVPTAVQLPEVRLAYDPDPQSVL